TGVFAGVNNLHARVKRRAKASKQKLQFAASSDPAWQEASLKARIEQLYLAYQQDWSTFNLQRMQTYMAPRYFAHVNLMMKALYRMGRQNNVGEPKLLASDVVEVLDAAENSNDTFTAYIRGQANDQLIDASTREVIFTDKRA